MLPKLVFIFAIFEVVSAISGYTTAGRRFSIALPDIGETTTVGFMRITTEESRASVSVSYPKNQFKNTTSYETEVYGLIRYESLRVNVLSKHTWKGTTGVYNTCKIQASTAVRVTVSRHTSFNLFGDTYNAIPEESCFSQYYVTTGKGYAFLAVMNFDSEVEVSVTFRETKPQFKFPCFATRTCASDSTVEVSLAKNKAWYLKLNEKLQTKNTLVEADKPIFVVAGNELWKISGLRPWKSLITSISPADSWGKEYITPRFIHSSGKTQKLILQFNVRKLPFRFKTFDGRSKKEEINSYDKDFKYDKFDRAYIISADVPFGLYQIFSSTNNDVMCNAAIVNVIPIEQWSNGGVITYLTSEDIWTNVVYTTAEKDGVSLSHDKINVIKWEKGISTKKRTYNYGLMTIRRVPAIFYTKKPNARMVVYRFSQPKSIKMSYACHAWPLQFYRSVIHYKKCKKTSTILNDGVDNDCDGYVDEEVKNGKDDDGDGKKDEDLIEINEENKWTSPTEACVTYCGKKKTTIKVRSCVRNRFGKDCPGEDKVCEPGPICPKYCKSPTCKCLDGCQKCQNNSLFCPECKDGHYDEEHCLRPCLVGWSGTGCSVGPRTIIEKRKRRTTTEDDYDDDDVEAKKTLETQEYNYKPVIIVVALTVSSLLLMIPFGCCMIYSSKLQITNNNDMLSEHTGSDSEGEENNDNNDDNDDDNDDNDDGDDDDEDADDDGDADADDEDEAVSSKSNSENYGHLVDG